MLLPELGVPFSDPKAIIERVIEVEGDVQRESELGQECDAFCRNVMTTLQNGEVQLRTKRLAIRLCNFFFILGVPNIVELTCSEIRTVDGSDISLPVCAFPARWSTFKTSCISRLQNVQIQRTVLSGVDAVTASHSLAFVSVALNCSLKSQGNGGELCMRKCGFKDVRTTRDRQEIVTRKVLAINLLTTLASKQEFQTHKPRSARTPQLALKQVTPDSPSKSTIPLLSVRKPSVYSALGMNSFHTNRRRLGSVASHT